MVKVHGSRGNQFESRSFAAKTGGMRTKNAEKLEERPVPLIQNEDRPLSTSALKRVAVVVAVCSILALTPARSATDLGWVDTWAAASDSAGPRLEAQTIRQIARTSVSGTDVRIRLSNLFGNAPVTVGPVHVAAHATGSSIQAGTDHVITFEGRPTVTIPPGIDVLSDSVAFPVAALEELAVTIYLPAAADSSTIHSVGLQTAYMTRGDATRMTTFPTGETDGSRYFLTDVEVTAAGNAGVIVIVGDSITDGVGSTEDRNARWPDCLAARLQADPGLVCIGVVNSGIAGNRILHNGTAPFLGPSLLARFDRDALNKPGARWILLLEGLNDISASDVLPNPIERVSAQQIIDGMKMLIARAHEKGIKIWGGTLMPYSGAALPPDSGLKLPFFTGAGEAKRQAVNQWIRTAHAFDAVVDLDQVMHDPAHPDRLLPAFDSGDHLHPNDAGHKAMAASIDLRLLGRGSIRDQSSS